MRALAVQTERGVNRSIGDGHASKRFLESKHFDLKYSYLYQLWLRE